MKSFSIFSSQASTSGTPRELLLGRPAAPSKSNPKEPLQSTPKTGIESVILESEKKYHAAKEILAAGNLSEEERQNLETLVAYHQSHIHECKKLQQNTSIFSLITSLTTPYPTYEKKLILNRIKIDILSAEIDRINAEKSMRSIKDQTPEKQPLADAAKEHFQQVINSSKSFTEASAKIIAYIVKGETKIPSRYSTDQQSPYAVYRKEADIYQKFSQKHLELAHTALGNIDT